MDPSFFLLQLSGGSSVGFRLDRPEPYVVGRSVACDFVIDHPSVSRRHAEVRSGPTGLEVRDLDSRNGTFIGSERIAVGRLAPGQQIQFGHVRFLVLRPADAEDATQSCTDEAQGRHSVRAKLTDAQARVFDALVRGLTEKGIATELRLSPNTVHHHIAAIYRVLDVSSRAEFFARIVQPP
jgi:pSer/pThr/pTyr-binding forkhead associated (FHA) protein